MPYTHITEVEFNCLKVSIEPKCINQSLNVTNVSMLNALRTFEKKCIPYTYITAGQKRNINQKLSYKLCL